MSGDIDGLILLPPQYRKLNAWRMLFEAAPGDLVAYSDDEVFFEAGWLDAQLEIPDTYPRVGMVSARHGGEYLPQYLEQYPGVVVKPGTLHSRRVGTRNPAR